MYTITFYSYKGGVGRSLALVNIGVQLARTGRSVLLVDFDLEAPGLDTFDIFKHPIGQKGVVDYFCDYKTNRYSPDVIDYCYKIPQLAGVNGNLWIMPAGRRDDTYENRLAELDWQDLYQNRNGFIAVEDLKAQWFSKINPDYVLIDSRTGHTDVEGICTRQLADAVTIVFFPNVQNLRGLKGVTAAIRSEEQGPLKKHIKMHFVMSNVPDLDDEENILEQISDEFKTNLNYRALSAVIHRYDSLHLLQQKIFTLERPRSRLANEYARLMDKICGENLKDRLVALQFIEKCDPNSVSLDENDLMSEKLQEIKSYHENDGAVLVKLAQYYKARSQGDMAFGILAHAKKQKYETVTVALEQTELVMMEGDKKTAIGLMEEAIAEDTWNEANARKLVWLIRNIKPELLKHVPAVAAKLREDVDRIKVAGVLDCSRNELSLALDILDLNNKENVIAAELAKSKRCLSLIGLERFDEASSLYNENSKSRMDLQDSFNLGFANWMLKDESCIEQFARVVALTLGSGENVEKWSANVDQCIALALFHVGRKKDAELFLDSAIKKVARVGYQFSCWQYLRVNEQMFKHDCAAMRKMFRHDDSPLPFNRSF